MNLEQQVTSLEISKRLKELGVKQESVLWWQQSYAEMKGDVSASSFQITQVRTESKKGMRCFSAFTVAELLSLLDEEITIPKVENVANFVADKLWTKLKQKEQS